MTPVPPVDAGRFTDTVERMRHGLDVSTAARELLTLLEPTEVLGLLDGDDKFWAAPDGYNRTPYVMASAERLGIPGIRFSDGPRGVVMGHSTAFPVSMARGATWDIELETEVGNAIGREVSARGGDFFAGVCINLLRHPAWGRAQETYGEDPILLGAMGAALTTGVRRHVMACVKHFALNSMENARFSADITIDEATLHEVYLPHFRTVIEAGAEGVMSAYNSVNGDWCGQSPQLLTDILREEWRFQGIVISDFIFGLRDSVASVRAGLDIEAPYSQLRAHELPIALKDGGIQWDEIERTALRVLETQLRWALRRSRLENTSRESLEIVAGAEHTALARRVAAHSMVLLRNEPVEGKPLLPLTEESITRLAVIGRLADLPNTGDNGSSNVHSPYVVTALAGLRAALPSAEVRYPESEAVEDAVRCAAEADVIVIVAGYSASDEGEFLESDTFRRADLRGCFPPLDDEARAKMTLKGSALAGENKGFTPFGGSTGGDRTRLTLSDHDEALIAAVSAVNPRTVVAIVAGSAVIVEAWKERVPAILMSWYAGMEGGNALADVLLGRHNPSGRLPFAVPTDSADLPGFDATATAVTYDGWHGQRLLDRRGRAAAFPFGFGLSYTRYSIIDAVVRSVDREGESIQVSATVRNEGALPGRHVVQWYASAVDGGEDDGIRSLLGFSVVTVPDGNSVVAEASLSLRPLTRRAVDSGTWVEPRGSYRLEASAFCGDPLAASMVVSIG